jgi:uroporphyrinogen-III synthase
LRGNVDTRLNKAQTDEYDAIVIAAAGILRLGRGAEITEYLDPGVFMPEPGQGAIAVQIRAGDADLGQLLGRIDHAPTRAAVTAERAFLRAFGGGCRNPMGAYAEWHGQHLYLRGIVGLADGSRIVRGELYGAANKPVELGAALANQLLENGASEFLVGKADLPFSGKRIVVTRTQEGASELGKKIRALGGIAPEWNTIAIEPIRDYRALDQALASLESFDWVVFTSANGVRVVADRLRELDATVNRLTQSRIAAVGPVTARALQERGIPVAFTPGRFSSDAMAAELPVQPGEKILLLRADLASADLPDGLRARGVEVTDVVAYHTVMPTRPHLDLQNADAVTFVSASAVKNLVAMLDDAEYSQLAALDIFCIGPATAQAAREAGLTTSAVASTHTLDGLVAAMVDYYKQRQSNL